MKKIILVLAMVFCFSGVAMAADVTLAWDANTEEDLAGYKIHYGEKVAGDIELSLTNTVDAGNVVTHIITDLVVGKVYLFAATAYDNETPVNESDYSDIILEYTVEATEIIVIPTRPKGMSVKEKITITID
jgi:hypothetical protein